jgi:hypothetical protein
MTSGTERLNEITKNTVFTFFPIYVFFYLILSKCFPRGEYPLIKTDILNNKISLIKSKLESSNTIKLRKKVISDLKMHKSHKNFKKQYITKISVNKDGKIIGYKFCTLFYPNYFTKIQNKNLIMDTKLVKKYRGLFLIVINYN